MILANQVGLDRPVALKVLKPEMVQDVEQVERFLAEARLASTLVHPNVVRVIDHDVEDGVPWIAFEYVPGRTLDSVAMRAPLPVEDAVSIGCQIAAALVYAHERGVLHRDVKPSNVLEDGPGRYKLADFGVAKWIGATTRTRAGCVVGTPAYLAPECLRGEPATPRSEVFSVGVILFLLLTGRHPYRESLVLLMQSAALGAPRPRELRPDTPAWLDDVVARALEPDPSRRTPTMSALLDEMDCGSRSASATRQSAVSRRPHGPPGPLLATAVGAAVALAMALVSGPASRERTALRPPRSRASPSPAPARDGRLAELTAALAAAQRGWLGRRADHELLMTVLLGVSPQADIVRAQRLAARLEKEWRPEVDRLEQALERARAATAPHQRSGADTALLASGAASACVFRLRLDRLAKLEAIAGRAARDGDVGALSLGSLAAELDGLRYAPELTAKVERFLRLAGEALADRTHAGDVLASVYWAGESFRAGRFPDVEQRAVERFAVRTFDQARASARDDAGRRLAAVAHGVWDLGRLDDARLFPARFAEVSARMEGVVAVAPEMAQALAPLRKELAERARRTSR